MRKELISELKRAFTYLKDRTRIILLCLVLLVIGTMFYNIFKAAFFIVLLTAVAGVSKVYHRFFKSSVGVDFVLFSTIIVAIAYKNIMFTMITGWTSLIVADTLGSRFSHTSIISLIGLSAVAVISPLLSPLPIIYWAVLLTLIFQVIAAALYSIMGSGLDRLAVFLVTHALFNYFLIFSFAEEIILFIR
ncbi:MAG: hypothetical protein HGA85_08990 [Nanoarchaeota archaeon]|nr:hypothetical protein [Nanoarchaeota archaeon]